MWHNAAQIDSPEVIKEFRRHFVKFGETSKLAIEGIKGDTRRVMQWLQHEQLPFWTAELRKAEEKRLDARTALSSAKNFQNVYGQSRSSFASKNARNCAKPKRARKRLNGN